MDLPIRKNWNRNSPVFPVIPANFPSVARSEPDACRLAFDLEVVHTCFAIISMGRNKAWTEDEYVALCQAVMDASTDPRVGKDQTAEMFWAKAKKNLDTLMKVGKKEAGRSAGMVQKKFKEVQKEVNVFVGMMNKVIRGSCL